MSFTHWPGHCGQAQRPGHRKRSPFEFEGCDAPGSMPEVDEFLAQGRHRRRMHQDHAVFVEPDRTLVGTKKRTRLRRSRSCGYRMVLKLSPPSCPLAAVLSLCRRWRPGAWQVNLISRNRGSNSGAGVPGKCSYQRVIRSLAIIIQNLEKMASSRMRPTSIGCAGAGGGDMATKHLIHVEVVSATLLRRAKPPAQHGDAWPKGHPGGAVAAAAAAGTSPRATTQPTR